MFQEELGFPPLQSEFFPDVHQIVTVRHTWAGVPIFSHRCRMLGNSNSIPSQLVKCLNLKENPKKLYRGKEMGTENKFPG